MPERLPEVEEATASTAAPGALATADHRAEVGVGPWEGEWPSGARWDTDLLAHGDRRNVADEFRYWTVDAIVAALDARRDPARELHVAIENWAHDLNIGSVVRTANAYNVAGVHIVGRRRWNKRGAMVTDRYLHVHHHPDADHLASWAAERGLTLVGVDNVAGSVPIEGRALPSRAVLVLGQESTGLTPQAQAACDVVVHVTQHGSTRSLNASAAGAIAMFAWALQHATP
ncbi:TrmH family RNA methyltransferase [Xylanimonas protaetiae]|uniref:RNA methyltransferase n=1 Tax=Xylanimonas protaetiae TaxID=2509457 RepID=A0A4P6FFF8_9MICO|nr:RNA methyltransferase [Xylanimonas protaetiae]QAY69328.1 RNA methyltransferase [Xylanimonas protaetiae]